MNTDHGDPDRDIELPRGLRITSKGRSVVELMDREHLSLEQALERVERDEPDMADDDIEQAADKAVGDTVPAEGWPDNSLLEAAWGLIANAFEGNWDDASTEWQAAAKEWRDAYHRYLDARTAAAAGQVAAEAVEALAKRLLDEGWMYEGAYVREVARAALELAAAAPGVIKVLDDGLTQHGDHIERLQRDVGRRDAVIERLEAEVARLTAENERLQLIHGAEVTPGDLVPAEARQEALYAVREFLGTYLISYAEGATDAALAAAAPLINRCGDLARDALADVSPGGPR